MRIMKVVQKMMKKLIAVQLKIELFSKSNTKVFFI